MLNQDKHLETEEKEGMEPPGGDPIDWKALERLRTSFLEGTAGARDYWKSERDLSGYDATFAQRIGWKWDYVLGELKRRNWSPPAGDLLDWGCGSGIASRAFLNFYGGEAVSRLWYWDRSPLAAQYAAAKAGQKYPGLPVATGQPDRAAVALVSHVLTELQPPQIEALAERMASLAQSVLWVEPGTYEASLTLIAVRERLRGRLRVVAPCTHQERCGILQPGNEAHWCHHFASPPPAVFTDPHWGKFARLAGVDLRSLPLSFLVLDARPEEPALAAGGSSETVGTPPASARRILGRPRIYKGYAMVLSSGVDGVGEHRLSKRRFPEEFRRAKKNELEPLQMISCSGEEIVSMRPL